MEKRYIELEVITTVGSTDKVFFKVKNNKRGCDFNDGQYYFNASNHIGIYSVAFPAWNGRDMLCVLGQNHKLDDMILIASCGDFIRIQQAVNEYNKKFSLPQFIFRVSLGKRNTEVEKLLQKLQCDEDWKQDTFDSFMHYADEVMPAGSNYNIDYIEVNNRMMISEIPFTTHDGKKGMIKIYCYIASDNWTCHYNNCKRYWL